MLLGHSLGTHYKMWLSRIFYLFIFVILVVANLNTLESVQATDISIDSEITVANTNTQ